MSLCSVSLLPNTSEIGVCTIDERQTHVAAVGVLAERAPLAVGFPPVIYARAGRPPAILPAPGE